MNRIIAFDVCSAAILLFLILSLYIRHVTRGITNKIFLVLLFTVFVSALSSITSTIYPYYNVATDTNVEILYTITYLYFISRNLTAPLFVLFTIAASGSWHKFKTKKSMMLGWGIPVLVVICSLLLNPFLHNVFFISSDMQYHRGPYILIVYINSFIVLLQAIFVVVKHKAVFSQVKYYAMLALVPVSLAGVIFQMIFPNILFEIFCTAFPMLLITLVIQKPEDIINMATGSLNYYAFTDEIKKNTIVNNPCSIIYISIHNFDGIQKQFRESVVNEFQYNLIKKFYSVAGEDETDVYTINDGFYAIISLKNNEDKLKLMAENVSLVLKEHILIENIEFSIDSKICLANYPEDLTDYKTLINFTLHFENIISKVNEVVFLADIASSKDFLMRTNLDDIIQNAITKKKFQMYYQPIYNIQKKKFTSAEALIRLIDDDYGFVSPGLFIPAAEISGAIHQIGDFVFEDVCRFISRCDFEKLGMEYIEINLSVAQTVEFNLAEKIQAIMKQYNVPPEKINLEITETAADFNPEVFDRNIGQLSEAGLKFSLDDYGTGYSNIQRVVSLPLSIIKFDKSFVDEYLEEKMNIVIRENVSMLKKIEKYILVEGIEKEEEFKFFQNLDVNYIQGFYFSKPLPESEFIRFIKEKNLGGQ